MLRWLRGAARRCEAEDGSTLVLYPFAVLVVLALGGLALDMALWFQAHREAVDAAAGLATDVAAVVDEAAFATTGEVRVDADRARLLVDLANRDLATHPYDLACTATVVPDAPDTVEVTCTGNAEAILLPVGGLLGDMRLEGTATASGRPGPVP